MPTPSYPGVYVTELPTTRPILHADTATATFVGRVTGPGEAADGLVTSWADFLRLYGRPGFGAQLPLAVYAYFASGGSLAHVVPIRAAGEMAAKADLGPLQVTTAVPGDWGNALWVQIINAPDIPDQSGPLPNFSLRVLFAVPEDGADLPLRHRLLDRFARDNKLPVLTIGERAFYQLELHAGMSAQYLAEGPNGGPPPIVTRINETSYFVRVAVPEPGAERPENTPEPVALSGGLGNPKTTPLDHATGLSALDGIDNVPLLVTPETALIDDPVQQRETDQATLIFAGNRTGRDTFVVLDTPQGLTPEQAVAYKTGAALGDSPDRTALNARHGALYYPWIEMFLPDISRSVLVPPAGAMAGVTALTDYQVGVWKAPAGTTNGALRVATAVDHAVTDAQLGLLNSHNVNTIRDLPQYGIVSWGARVLDEDPEVLYIPVQRTLMMIEQSVRSGLFWVGFVPNTAETRASVTRDVTNILQDLWRAGAILGAASQDAFFVTCDESNNPPGPGQADGLQLDLGVALRYPAEYMRLNFTFSGGT